MSSTVSEIRLSIVLLAPELKVAGSKEPSAPLAQRDGLRICSPSYSELVPQQNPPFHIADATYVESQYSSSDTSPMNFEGASPASSASSLSIDSDYQRDRSPGVGKRDPSWVARPRNCFMIFRCQYSREHCREGKRVRRPPGSKPEKSLSKRAAEAWHLLSAEEKERFQALAHQEASEHARLHPGYRFRPLRKGSGKIRNSPSLSVPMIGAQRQFPPQVKKEDVKAVITSQDSVPLQNESATTKASRRRSSSVPISAEQPVISDKQNVRTLHRRSRSIAEGWASLSIPESPPSYLEHAGPWTQMASFSIPDPSEPHAMETVDNNAGLNSHNSVYNPSPISAGSSTLLNWNGEYVDNAINTTFCEASSPLHVPTSTGIDSGAPLMHFPDFSQSMEPGLEHLLYQSPTYLWAHDLPRYPISAGDMTASHVMGESAMQIYDSGGCTDLSINYAHSHSDALGILSHASDDLSSVSTSGVNVLDYYAQF
ncbi:hypothetical protein BDQ17DRAFT_1323110 [Cyathus striatus]|nr:hypothetical protein BDQ17DRAFT_1323110 [Cyathus striatus]